MATSRKHRILIGNDGSPAAEAALATALRFPWGEGARARGVVARTHWLHGAPEGILSALSSHSEAVVEATQRTLSAQWPGSQVVMVDENPADALLHEAQRFKATAIVLGWRGHGTFHRLLAGSVSRTVAAHAPCPVLVARQAPSSIRRFVIGFDGCANALRALDFVCSLEPVWAGRVTLVNVLEPLSTPRTGGTLPAPARALIRREAQALSEERAREARAAVDKAWTRLTACGWSVKREMPTGAPLSRLLAAVDEHRADVLILGARAVSGLERALLGSVANGALNHARVPVVIVR